MISQKITFDTGTIQFMKLFESLTGAKLKDCFLDREKLVFLVDEGEIGKALGKGKENVTRIEKMMNRKIKIVEFNPNKLQFIANYLAPLRITGIKENPEEEGVIIINGADTKTKGLIIGVKAQNLRNLEKITSKYFDIKEIKVI